MTAPRPAVDAIDAAIEQCQTSIRKLMEARRAAVQFYDNADIDAALDALDDEPCCGGNHSADVAAVIRANAEAVTP